MYTTPRTAPVSVLGPHEFYKGFVQEIGNGGAKAKDGSHEFAVTMLSGMTAPVLYFTTQRTDRPGQRALKWEVHLTPELMIQLTQDHLRLEHALTALFMLGRQPEAPTWPAS